MIRIKYKGKYYNGKEFSSEHGTSLVQIWSHTRLEGEAISNYSEGKYKYAYNIQLLSRLVKIVQESNTVGGILI